MRSVGPGAAALALVPLVGCESAPKPIGPAVAPKVAEVLGYPVHARSAEEMQ